MKIGEKLAHLTLQSGNRRNTPSGGHTYYAAQWLCDCGKVVKIVYTYVTNGRRVSCGCIRPNAKDWVKAAQFLGDKATIQEIADAIGASPRTVMEWIKLQKKAEKKTERVKQEITIVETNNHRPAVLGVLRGKKWVFQKLVVDRLAFREFERLAIVGTINALVAEGKIIRGTNDYVRIA